MQCIFAPFLNIPSFFANTIIWNTKHIGSREKTNNWSNIKIVPFKVFLVLLEIKEGKIPRPIYRILKRWKFELI